MIYMKLVKYTGIFISIVFLFSCEDSSKTSQSEQIQKVDQEFIQYLDKEIANPQLYFHPDVVKCILKNASEISAPFKSYVNDKQGFGKEGFESEDIVPPAILEDYQKFVNQYCM